MPKKIGELAVHLHKDGEVHSFLPGDEVPGWAAEQMGDHCFAGGEDQFDEEGAHPPVINGGASAGGPPPQSGRGSGIDAWRDYALDQEIDVQEDWTREQIIAELEAAGKPV